MTDKLQQLSRFVTDRRYDRGPRLPEAPTIRYTSNLGYDGPNPIGFTPEVAPALNFAENLMGAGGQLARLAQSMGEDQKKEARARALRGDYSVGKGFFDMTGSQQEAVDEVRGQHDGLMRSEQLTAASLEYEKKLAEDPNLKPTERITMHREFLEQQARGYLKEGSDAYAIALSTPVNNTVSALSGQYYKKQIDEQIIQEKALMNETFRKKVSLMPAGLSADDKVTFLTSRLDELNDNYKHTGFTLRESIQAKQMLVESLVNSGDPEASKVLMKLKDYQYDGVSMESLGLVTDTTVKQADDMAMRTLERNAKIKAQGQKETAEQQAFTQQTLFAQWDKCLQLSPGQERDKLKQETVQGLMEYRQTLQTLPAGTMDLGTQKYLLQSTQDKLDEIQLGKRKPPLPQVMEPMARELLMHGSQWDKVQWLQGPGLEYQLPDDLQIYAGSALKTEVSQTQTLREGERVREACLKANLPFTVNEAEAVALGQVETTQTFKDAFKYHIAFGPEEFAKKYTPKSEAQVKETMQLQQSRELLSRLRSSKEAPSVDDLKSIARDTGNLHLYKVAMKGKLPDNLINLVEKPEEFAKADIRSRQCLEGVAKYFNWDAPLYGSRFKQDCHVNDAVAWVRNRTTGEIKRVIMTDTTAFDMDHELLLSPSHPDFKVAVQNDDGTVVVSPYGKLTPEQVSKVIPDKNPVPIPLGKPYNNPNALDVVAPQIPASMHPVYENMGLDTRLLTLNFSNKGKTLEDHYVLYQEAPALGSGWKGERPKMCKYSELEPLKISKSQLISSPFDPYTKVVVTNSSGGTEVLALGDVIKSSIRPRRSSLKEQFTPWKDSKLTYTLVDTKPVEYMSSKELEQALNKKDN